MAACQELHGTLSEINWDLVESLMQNDFVQLGFVQMSYAGYLPHAAAGVLRVFLCSEHA